MTMNLKFTSYGLRLLIMLSFGCQMAFAQEKPVLCGTRDADAPQQIRQMMSQLPAIMARQNARTAAGEMRICRVAVEIDSDTYVKYERDTAAIIQTVIGNIEKCSKFYEREANFRMMVTSIRIFKDTEPNPYANAHDVHAMLTILANRQAADQNFDKRIYLYTKPVGGGASGVAFIGGAYNVSPLENAATLMHEFAHNFGSYHANNCGWPGGPLDYCGGVEGDCYTKSSEVNTKGSLMSRCGSNGAGAALHPMIKAVITQHAEVTFAKMESAPQAPSLPGDITAAKGDFYTWPASTLASTYEFSYSTDVNFNGETVETTVVNGINLLKQTLGADYFVRVRARNAFGTSDWSNTVKIRIDPDQPDVPVLLGPANHTFLPAQIPVTLSFLQVPGAASYQVQVSPLVDFNFAFPTSEIIFGNQYNYVPYFGGYKWRVRAIVNGKTGKWSEIGYFSANARLNVAGLYLPVPDNLLDVPRTIPIAYAPSTYYSNTRITVADNPEFNSPLFQRNYEPFLEIADVLKDLPANTQLYLRVQERQTDLINYPDRDLVDYTVQFTTGSANSPFALTFLSEKDQPVFGKPNPKIAVSKGHVWLGVLDAGFIKLDQKALTFQTFNRANTDGLLGVGMDNPVRTDNERNVYTVNPADGYRFRKVGLVNETPSGDATVTTIPFVGYIQDFSPQHQIFWTQRVIFKETPGGFTALRQVSDSQLIKDIRFRDNKAWILILNLDRDYSTEILVMDLNDHDLIYTIDYQTSPAIENVIDQIEIQPDGKVWLRQTDYSTQFNSLAYFDGTSWSLFDSGNAPFGTRISSISISPSGQPYVLAVGSEAQVYKFHNGQWEKAGDALPYQRFDGDLWVDTYESFWISNRFGLARLASDAALPVTLVHFRAAPENNTVVLNWKVTDQVDMARYEIEHSTDAKRFHVIGETPAIDTTLYSFVHTSPAPGTNYYRLKMVDSNTDFALSKMVKVNMNDLAEIIIYPNPAATLLLVKTPPELIGRSGRITVFSTNGSRIYAKKIDHFRAQEPIDVSTLAAGNYLIKVENGMSVSSRIVQVMR